MAAKIKKGDTVKVLNGRDKGKTGQVTRMFPKEDRVLIEGVNVVWRHQRPSRQAQGGIVKKNAPIHISNVALVDSKSGKATRVGFKIEDGKKVRVARKSGEVIDG